MSARLFCTSPGVTPATRFTRLRCGATSAPIAYNAGTSASPTGGATTPTAARIGPPTASTQPVMFFVEVAYRSKPPGLLVATNVLEHFGKGRVARVEHLPAGCVGDLFKFGRTAFAEQYGKHARRTHAGRQAVEIVQEVVRADALVVFTVGHEHDARVRLWVRGLV